MPLADSFPVVASRKGIPTGVAGNYFIPIPCGNSRVLVRKCTVTNASASLASSTGTGGLSVSSGATGTIIVTAATGVLTTLTGSTITFDATIAATALAVLIVPVIPTGTNPDTGVPFTEAGVYFSIAGTPNVTATVDVYLSCDFYQ